jgi:hypothetical protein
MDIDSMTATDVCIPTKIPEAAVDNSQDDLMHQQFSNEESENEEDTFVWKFIE